MEKVGEKIRKSWGKLKKKKIEKKLKKVRENNIFLKLKKVGKKLGKSKKMWSF